MKIKPLLKLGSCFVVGNGQCISIWDDLWIPLIPGFKPSGVHPRSTVVMTVNELIDSAIGQWNRALVWATFNQSNAAIVKIHLSSEARREELL